MKLHIDISSYLNDIQDSFHRLFPGFKLEFQFNGNEKLHFHARLGKSFPHIRINELCQSPKAFVDIEGKMTVKEVENLFRQHFGLPAQVFVKEGKYWLKSPAFDSRKLMN
jgi:hypothetical protein